MDERSAAAVGGCWAGGARYPGVRGSGCPGVPVRPHGIRARGCCYVAVVPVIALYIELWRDPDAIPVSADHLGAASPGRLAACTHLSGQRRRACAGERLMRRADAGDPGRGTAGQRDLAWRVLAVTAARMRSGRRDWGLAMLAELDHITAAPDRARFAFGAVRVALFPPHPSRPRGAGPVGLSVRAVIAGAAIHALAPAAGIKACRRLRS